MPVHALRSEATRINKLCACAPEAISEAALYYRMYRVFQQKKNGQYKVPVEAVDQWKRGDKSALITQFKECGYKPDPLLV